MMDLLIASLPRSGSTMLASALTVPPDQVVLHEANMTLGQLFEKGCIARINRQLEPFGAPAMRTRSEVAAWLNENMARWGTKEVNARSIESTVDQYKPRKIVIITRNARHAGMSALERKTRISQQKRKQFLNHIREAVRHAAQCARVLIKLSHRDDAIVVPYERYVQDEPYRREVCQTLGWSDGGDIASAFSSEHWPDASKSRMYEVARHNGQISAASVTMRQDEVDEAALAVADAFEHECRRYQEHFGYA